MPRPRSALAAPARVAARVAPLAVAVALMACGGSSGGDAATGAGTLAAEVEWVRDHLRDWYLYADRLPTADLAALATAEQALDALRVNPPDRFSYVERRQAYDRYFDDGMALGLGVGYRIGADAIELRLVQPRSPAAEAGLARGDRILAIDGAPATTLIAEGRVADAFGPSQAGLSVTLDIAVPGGIRRVSVAKDWYPVSAVLATRVIEHAGRRIGYVLLATFIEPARQAWADALATLALQGVDSLVVDLRENGGGRLHVAAEIAASLAPAGAGGGTFVELRYNGRHAESGFPIALPATVATGRFERIVWITSPATCSASESLIAGLMAYRPTAIIGDTTCGKPIGFDPVARGDKVLSAVTFSTVNRDGFGGWFDGLAPDCHVAADPLLPYGDPNDPKLVEALAVLATGGCTAAAGKSIAARVSLPVERGLAAETGLR